MKSPGMRNVPFMARRNYHYELQHIFLWGLLAGVVEGNLGATMASKTFHGSDLLITVAATTPVATHLASLLWGMLCMGRAKIRLFTIVTSGAVLLTGSVAFVPHCPWAGWLFVAQMAAAQFFMTGAITVRSAVWKSNYPKECRGQITARLHMVRAVTQFTSVAIASKLLDYHPAMYRWLFPLLALIGALAIIMLRRIHVRGERSELRHHTTSEESKRPNGQLAEPFSLTAVLSPYRVLSNAGRILVQDTRFRSYMIAQMCAGFAYLMVRAVLVTVLTKYLFADSADVYWNTLVILDLLPILVMLASMGIQARFFDRAGVLRFREFQGILWTITLSCGMLGTLLTIKSDLLGSIHIPLAVAAFALYSIMRGLCLAGGSLAWNLGHLHFAHPKDAEVYMGIHVSLTGLRGLIMPGIGSLLWVTIGWPVWIASVSFSVISWWKFRRLSKTEPEAASGEHTP